MPRATIDGDRVHITGVRNFEYRGRNDFTAHYEERDLQLSHMTGLDFFVSYWSEGPVAHTFLSFIFDNASPLSISIETRPEMGEGFDPVASLFKQFELIYVVGDERDLVRVRKLSQRRCLYHLNSSADAARRLFMIYLERINDSPIGRSTSPAEQQLYDKHRVTQAAGRTGRFDIRRLLNGLIDGYLYHSGRVDTTLEFDELKRRSLINEVAQEADGAPDFSERIRASLPKIAR
jgi:hypothetical protein